MTRAPARSRGFTLLEALVSTGIIAIVVLASASFLWTEWRQGDRNRDEAFAYDRAQSILEELRAFAEVGESQDAATLDAFDDGVGYSYSLTTLKKPSPNADEFVDPDAVVSGNTKTDGKWRYARRISVRHLRGVDQRDLRVVTVRIFLNAGSEVPPGTLLVSCASVIRTIADPTPPTQVYDVYFVALENVPGWWVYMDTIRPFMEASLQDLVGRNPGLKFRSHWITKLGYGRNPQYTPFFNEATPSTATGDNVYFYPGLMPNGSASSRYYVPSLVKGRANIDGVVTNGFDAAANPWPYALADQHNHCMRLPEEEALFEQRVAAGVENEDEPTWRIFLERLNSDPDRYRNAIVVNLHGELLPLPPVRNYSDAAREPERLPGVRAVTHPEKLRAVRGTDDVRLRVYTYRKDPAVLPERLDVPVILDIKGINLAARVNGVGASGPDTLQVERIAGGLDISPLDGQRDDYAIANAPVVLGPSSNFSPAFPAQMYCRVYWSPTAYNGVGATVVELHSSPLTCNAVSTNRGLAAARRLYGMEYVPCPTEAAGDFSVNLTSPTTGEKNTARWIVRIPAAMLGSEDRRVDVVTRLGRESNKTNGADSAAFATGIMYPPESRAEPENVSVTHAWYAATGNGVPFTERYQFQGDPRHCPYADLKAGGSGLANGYNWYFDDFENASANAIASWPGFDAARLKNGNGSTTDDGWENRLDVDLPRFFQLVRDGLERSNALYTTLTGWSYYYVGLGNEIGYDAANGYTDSIPVSGKPFGLAGSCFEQSITNDTPGTSPSSGVGVKVVRSNATANYWWEMSWLGELYPDSMYASSWKVPRYEYSDTPTLPSTLPPPKGNLPTGTVASASTFKQVPRDQIAVNLPAGTSLHQSQRRTQQEGCTSFMNVGATSSSVFHHQGQTGTTGPIADGGTEVSRDFHFPLPDTAKISRPFRLAASADGGVGDEFPFTADYPRASVTARRNYYGHSTGATGSALLELSSPGISTPAFVVVSGIDRTTESGSAFIARFAMLTLIHGFLSAGDPALPNPIALRPRTVLMAPTAITEIEDPLSITVRWHTERRRWDGIPYTTTFPPNLAPLDVTNEYVLTYSADNGKTWRHMLDDTLATPGVAPTDPTLRMTDQVANGDEAYTWPTPEAKFPMGTYRIRVETYRAGARLHYSFHEERIYINR